MISVGGLGGSSSDGDFNDLQRLWLFRSQVRGRSVGLSDITPPSSWAAWGTRLRTVVSDRPKVLASVRGRPFVAFLLDQLVDRRQAIPPSLESNGPLTKDYYGLLPHRRLVSTAAVVIYPIKLDDVISNPGMGLQTFYQTKATNTNDGTLPLGPAYPATPGASSRPAGAASASPRW